MVMGAMPDYQILVPPPRRHRKLVRVIMIVAAVVVVGAAGGGAYVIARHKQDDRHAAARNGGNTTIPSLTVTSSTPKTGATNVPSDQVVTVDLSLPVANASGMPMFSPPVSGKWSKVGPKALSFRPTAPFIPTSTETLVLPAGDTGPHSTDGRVLGAPV